MGFQFNQFLFLQGGLDACDIGVCAELVSLPQFRLAEITAYTVQHGLQKIHLIDGQPFGLLYEQRTGFVNQIADARPQGFFYITNLLLPEFVQVASGDTRAPEGRCKGTALFLITQTCVTQTCVTQVCVAYNTNKNR